MDNNLLPRVCDEIDRGQDAMVSLLRDLVQARSILGNERPAQEIMHATWQSLGLESKIWEPSLEMLSSHRAFAPVEWGYDGRPNVTAIWRSTVGGGRSLVLNGHIDVVSPEPTSLWSHDPWGAEIVDGKMYGRGACDMKGGIAMAALAVRALRACGVVLEGDVIAETVLEEECSGNGTLACRLAGYNADGAVVCEPHFMTANVGTMGVMWFRVRVIGSGAHVLKAHEAVNAIEKCFPIVAALRQLEAEMNAEPRHPLFKDHPHPINLNVGKMHGGDWPSNVPSLCEFECRISYQPGVSPDDVRKRIEACISEAVGKDPWLRNVPPTITYYGFRADGSVTDPRTDLVRTLARCHLTVLGEDLKFGGSAACNDIRYFTNNFSTPAIAYGPRGAGYHGADEYVELDTIVAGAKVLASFIMEWCGVRK